jgi:GrpB-like predicted nucleotidyltransferase (UPF0157 family)
MEQTPADNRWSDRFAQERDRILAALGAMPDGGIIEHLEHVGATSVPDLLGQPCMDIALAVWPFPLEEPARQALAALGYALDPDFSGAPEQRFAHAGAPVRLYLVEAGSPLWTDYLAVREHLRHDPAARQALSANKQAWADDAGSPAYRDAKRRWLDQLLGDAHRSWTAREGFAPLHRVAEELRDFSPPWHVCGGWALDLFLCRVTRVHQDVDVVVSHADQLILQDYLTARGWTLLTPYEERLHPWPPHMRLEPPRHQAHAHRRGAFIDFLLTDQEGGVWRYRRDPAIVRDLSRLGLQADDGIPFLAPELVLLFKSKNTSGRERAKDQVDFEAVCARLEPERRAWLRWALLAAEPSHPWLERL